MFYKNFAYEASAGSGKTFALVIRYISLLYMGAKPGSILALTFTNKAANEMKVRVMVVLKELHLAKRAAELSELSAILEMDKELILQKREKIVTDFLASDIKISTIDKFFSLILRKFSLHLGLMPDFGIEEQELQNETLKKFLSLVVKSGKYESLIKFSVKESKRLKDIFSLFDKFYEKDRELKDIEIKEANAAAVEHKLLGLVYVLKELFYDCKGLSNSAKKALDIESIEDLLKQSWICKESLEEYRFFKKCFMPRADELFFEIKQLLRAYYEAKDNYLKSQLLDLYTIFKETKRDENIKKNLLSFNDVTNSVYNLLSDHIDSDFLYFRLDSKIDHVLIDEYQDTNVIQYKILEPVIDEITSGIGTKAFKTFFYVGDIKQSIYRFRGGAKELFYHTKNRYDVEMQPLKMNFRSKFQVVDFVNKTFNGVIPNYIDQLSNDNQKEGHIKVSENDELLDNVVENILDLLNIGVLEDDIAILTYTNDDAFLIEEALYKKDKSLTITTETTSKLINNPKVASVIELLKYLYFKDELFKVNFLTLNGFSWDEKIDFSKFDKTKELPSLVKDIIDCFKIFHHDDNLLKFVEILFNYKDIESFLFECETLNVDAPSTVSQGIRLLTIHKSKGLEFEHVIVVDRFKEKKSGGGNVIFNYDDIDLKEFYIRQKGRECIDQVYKGALEKEKVLANEDELNVQYVAFTRAKESLIVCKKQEKSSFTNLNLTPVEIGELKIKKKKEIVSEAKDIKYERMIIGPQENKIKKDKQKKDDIKAINFGIALHYMLEIMKDFDITCIEEAYWGMKNRFEMILNKDETDEIKGRVEQLIENQEFLSLVNGICKKEQPIAYNNELKQVDLIVEKKDSVTVIDYKTSHEERPEHIKQVKYYKEAMEKIYKQKIDAYLCYLKEKEVKLLKVS